MVLTASGGRRVLAIGRIRRVADWPLRTKLAMVLLTPTIVAVVLGATQVRSELALAGQASALTGRVAVWDRVRDVVHALQQERDAGANAQSRTDSAIAALDAALKANPDVAAADDVAQARRGLRGLDATRKGADGYAEMIAPLLAVGVPVRDGAGNPTISTAAGALTDLGKAIEQYRVQEWLLANAADSRGPSPETIGEVRVAGALSVEALAELRQSLTPAQRAAFADAVDGDARTRFEQLRDGALSRGASGRPLGVSSQAWQLAAQPVVDQLTAYEGTLSGSLRSAVDGLGVSSKTNSLRDSALVIGALLLGLAIALYFAATMLRPLWTLRRRALEIADHDLPGVIDRIAHSASDPDDLRPDPVEVDTAEEIGQVARAFDEVHSSAVRLAVEQASLRHSVNEIFVNLSLRTQSLVQSQLNMIDGMEAEELDPDQLDRLFKLDHLATRMRRNSENLLVLAGATPRRTSGQPVSVADLLRAAVSEVEQYTRIVLKPTPDLAVVGSAVSDIVHLLAELLDNATSFSAPDTKVTVVCTTDDAGTLRVSVSDEGVGMTPDELGTFNRQLADAASIEAAASRRMGLFVVSRLAIRRGISVRLRANVGAGTVADVGLPAALLHPVDPPETTALVPAQNPKRNYAMAAVVVAARKRFVEGPPSDEPAWPSEEPAEGTPIFEAVASTWFRSAGMTADDENRDWRTDSDALWNLGDSLDNPVIGGFTAAGLPRRVKGALLLKGSAPVAADPVVPAPQVTSGRATP
ncbi:nitrate- and nitrite sensing domain-containing protein [Kutzneria buriramensis]|uniref:histidine kinase n=1 Tax=Kutzneria buriramensis TaxID=1045776 RepID=A0A3E0HCE9_9PSEU|nr:nitrate- and nitrite sensing domain-containing protein [Kutzneria buriramensis]REH42527.1 signal transduction histidine kinase [Kutzneria buriramensis]